MRKDEKLKATKALNDIASETFRRALVAYEKGDFESFWDLLESFNFLLEVDNRLNA